MRFSTSFTWWVVVGVLGDDLTEEGLRGDVEAVGGLVKEQVVGVERQGRGDEALLLLTKRHLGVFARRVHIQLIAEFEEEALVVFGIELAEFLYIINRCTLRDGEVLRDEVDLLEGFGQAVEGRDAIHLASAGGGLLQAADEFQQGGLPHSIFAQQPVDVTLLEAEADVFEDWLTLVADCNHVVVFCVSVLVE